MEALCDLLCGIWRRWRDASEAELAEYKPRYREQAKRKLAQKNKTAVCNNSAGLVDGSKADIKSDANLSQSANSLPVVLRLFQPMEFWGTCVQNKTGNFPCPTVGRLLERGVSQQHNSPIATMHIFKFSAAYLSYMISLVHLLIWSPALHSHGPSFHWLWALQGLYDVEYDGVTPLFESPEPITITSRFECPAWQEPTPADKWTLLYDEKFTARRLEFVYGALGEPGEFSSLGCIK
jgi:hypothetical protein